MTVKQKNKIYSILICLLGVAAVVLALVIAISPSPENEAISDAKKAASEADKAKENEEKLKEESAKKEAEKQESVKQESSKTEEPGREAAKKEESVRTEESSKQDNSSQEGETSGSEGSSAPEDSSKTEESSDREESSKTEESSKQEESSEPEESTPVQTASGSGTLVSDSGTYLNLIVDWSIDTDASGNEILTLTAYLETYGLSASAREEGLYVTIDNDVEVYSTEAVENSEGDLTWIPLKTITLDWPGGARNVQVSWRFGGVYGDVELDYIIAEGRISD